MSGIIIYIESIHGNNIPKVFKKQYDSLAGWKGASFKDLKDLDDPVECETYWDAWDNILCNAYKVDKNGNHWTLYEKDGDVYLYCRALMTDDERNLLR